MKRTFTLLTSQILFLTIISCTNNDDSPNMDEPVIHSFTTSLTPESGTKSDAYGTATLLLDERSKVFNLTVTYSGLTATTGKIQSLNKNVAIDISTKSPLALPTYYTSQTLTSNQINELMANHYYINLNTKAYPTGEIGGTLTYTGTYNTSDDRTGGGYIP